MEIRIVKKEEIDTIHFSGQFWKIHDLEQFTEKANELIENENKAVLIDMRRLSYISSQGLGVIIRAFLKMNEKKKRLVLYKPHGNVREMIEISGLHKLMEICDSDEQLETFKTHP